MNNFNGLTPLSQTAMHQLTGGDRKRTVTKLDLDGDGEVDMKLVQVTKDGKTIKTKVVFYD